MENSQPSNSPQDKIDFFLLSAHELRTSLTAMKWLFNMLKDGDYGPLTAEQQAAVEQAMQSNDNMVALLNNTMNSIKNDSPLAYAKLPVHVAVLIAEIIKEFADEAASKHIALTYHQSAVPVVVIGDESKLRIAFHNIIENAIKYSNPNTEVLISLSAQNMTAIVEIQDQGIGIPQNQTEHLFEQFFRAGNNKETGTGIGLYSTKVIIEHHGGNIAMQSEEGKGTTVTITLPLQA